MASQNGALNLSFLTAQLFMTQWFYIQDSPYIMLLRYSLISLIGTAYQYFCHQTIFLKSLKLISCKQNHCVLIPKPCQLPEILYACRKQHSFILSLMHFVTCRMARLYFQLHLTMQALFRCPLDCSLPHSVQLPYP